MAESIPEAGCKPLVSVVLPCFRCERWIASALDSLKASGFPPHQIEVVIVDDGSGKFTATRLLKMVQSFPYRFVLVRLFQNRKQAFARNAGARISRGAWLFFLDADDQILPCAFRVLCRWSEKFPDAPALLVGRVDWYPDRSGEPRFSNLSPRQVQWLTFRDLLSFRTFPWKTPFAAVWISRTRYLETGGQAWYWNLNISADFEFLIRLTHQYGPVPVLPEPLYLYRQHPDQVHRNASAWVREIFQIYRYWLPRLSSWLDRVYLRSRMYWVTGGSLLRHGDSWIACLYGFFLRIAGIPGFILYMVESLLFRR